MNTLFLITARGGSKGIPGKNIKLLNGKPLLHYSIEMARHFAADDDICLSTDSVKIKKCAEKINLNVPFIRPDRLALDNSGSYEVLLHAIEYYEQQGRNYDRIVLLQPTSPFRKQEQVKNAIDSMSSDIEMMIGVMKTDANPYYTLFEVNEKGYLSKSKKAAVTRRQDAPDVYQVNGAIYVINVNALKLKPLHEMTRLKYVEMDRVSSTDLDNPLDWKWAEFLMQEGLV